jgi:hypothetical protein
MATSIATEPEYQHPPWPAAVAALIAFAALALSSGATVPLLALGLGLLASYAVGARFENVTLTKWTLRIFVIGLAVFGYLLNATKDDNAFFDMRYPFSFVLGAASELTLQFWRREPTGGPRAPLTVLLSALVFVLGCTTTDDRHFLWVLAPAYFLFFTLALPSFRPRAVIPLGLTLLPGLVALALGGATHAGLYVYRGALNSLGAQNLSSRHVSVSMGMSGQPLLGSSFTLRDSLTRVLRVQNLGTDPYLVGMTFDTYSGRTWGPAMEGRTFLMYHPPTVKSKGAGTHPAAPPINLSGGPPQRGGRGGASSANPSPLPLGEGGALRVASAEARAGKGSNAHVVRLDSDVALLFLPLHSASIRPEDDHPIDWAAHTDGPLRTPMGDTAALVYDIVPGRRGVLGSLFDTPPTAEEEARDLVVPHEIDVRVLVKAHDIGASLMKPQDKIEAVTQFLYRNNRYSLTVNPGPGDPISNFVLQRKAAHCEYFASAAVVLLRALGVPTRYVSGYFVHESDGRGWTLVRQRDAHAWAQSWVRGVGWVTVDATPGGGRPDALAGPIPVWWRAWEWMQDALGTIRQWVVAASWLERGTAFGLLVLGLLVPQVYRYWQRRRLASLGFQYSRPDAALAALAERFESLLARRGLPCPEGRTWREHLRAIEEEGNARPAPWTSFVAGYGRARFGTAPGPTEIARLDAELRTLERETA